MIKSLLICNDDPKVTSERMQELRARGYDFRDPIMDELMRDHNDHMGEESHGGGNQTEVIMERYFNNEVDTCILAH